MVGPTNALLATVPPNFLFRSSRTAVSSLVPSGLVVIKTLFGPACCTVASTLKVSISRWITAAWVGCLNSMLNWSPPAKSMPRRKPKKSIEMMPGRMIASDSRKYQLRRPTISI